QDGEDALAAGGRVAPGGGEQGVLADLGLPAAAGAAAARLAGGVDDHVADLAAVAAVAGHRAAGGDDPAADAGVAVEVDDVVTADGGAAGVFGQRGQVGVVAYGDTPPAAGSADDVPQRLAERLVDPAELRAEPDIAIL